MKKAIIMTVAAGLVAGAYADVTQFTWGGALESNVGVEPAAFTTTAFTYTSGDMVMDLGFESNGDIDIANLLTSIGDDMLWGPTSVDILPVFQGGGFAATVNDNESIAGQYAYALIFDGVFTDIADVTAGTQFGTIALDAAYLINNLGPTPAPGDLQNFDAGTVQMTNMTIAIPEPATLGLMGIAGLGMFLARKKARR